MKCNWNKTYRKVFLYCGFLMLISEIWKQCCLTYISGHGHYNWWYFPFQLCSIPMYICLLLPWIKSEKIHRFLLTFLMDFGLLAGIFTFFDTSGLHYNYMPLTIHSYLWHILLIFLGIFSGMTRETDCSLREYAGSAGLFLKCCLLATIFNYLFHCEGEINMFYISPYCVMNQKFFCHIAQLWGNTAGILSYIVSILFGAFLFHQLWKYFLSR